MPFLRFSRDKRGYENTYVLHGFRRGARSRPKVLYWFRTPPNVKIGRLPLDEEAIRGHRGEQPGPVVRLERDAQSAAEAGDRHAPGAGRSADPEAPGRIRSRRRWQSGAGEHGRRPGGGRTLRRRGGRPGPGSGSGSGSDCGRPRRADGPIDAEAFPEGVVPDDDEAEGEVERPWQHPVVALIGDDGLARLRARYAELQARISEKLTEPSAREAMRARVEALNPDSWRTGEQVVHGIERFEAAAEEIKKTLGRRRRRSRRGGARRRRPKSPD